MSNPGARDSFGRGGSADVLREAILHVTGTQVRVQVVVEPGQAAEPAAVVPRQEPARSQRPAAAAQARGNIRSTSTTVEPPPVEEQPSREDASVEEGGGNHDELLAKHLGAELIAEED
jgi:DNA polymerase III subunit gamma/tau